MTACQCANDNNASKIAGLIEAMHRNEGGVEVVRGNEVLATRCQRDLIDSRHQRRHRACNSIKIRSNREFVLRRIKFINTKKVDLR